MTGVNPRAVGKSTHESIHTCHHGGKCVPIPRGAWSAGKQCVTRPDVAHVIGDDTQTAGGMTRRVP